jgi:deoxyribodipyrimidine photo-lyase
MTSSLLWFRNDLRLADNPALAAALSSADKLTLLYVLDDDAPGAWRMGGASRWWLHHSIASLAQSISSRGAKLMLRRGSARKIIPELAAELKVTEVHAGRSFEPWARAQDRDIAMALKSAGIVFKRHLSALLFAPETIKNKTGGIYGVYTPFSRACFERGPLPDVIEAPEKIPGVPKIATEKLDDWGLLPTRPDWASGLREIWLPGEGGAHTRLNDFLQRSLHDYKTVRNNPGEDGTSGLSPHLHFGEISAAAVWRAATAHGKKGSGLETFLKEILWREFAAYLLWHHPDMPEKPLRAEFSKFPWEKNEVALAAWQRGMTGIPIVDAGMRQLWKTGWMHNRVRMVCASFLIKHLLIPWQNGEAWFWDTLVDADLASNAISWQWVAGCGADAAPYFRIFNPVLQGNKFDPEGKYVRKYVPELTGLPNQYIHAPWEAEERILAAAQVKLGSNYPRPIINLAEGRERALAAFKTVTDFKNE